MSLLRLFAEHLLPVFLAAGFGYALAATLRPDPRPISQVAFHVFAPCLVYQIMADSSVTPGALPRMMGFVLLTLGMLAAITAALARLLRLGRTMSSAVVLAALLPNAGNFGLSANLLAFGPGGMAQAGLFFVCSSIVTFTAGVLVASLGRASLGQALRGLAGVPVIWAVALGFVMTGLRWSLPRPAAFTVQLLAQACIPTLLVILGIQLRESRLQGPIKPLLLASSMRMLGGALLALTFAPLLGLEGAARQAGIFQASMPTAVVSTILAQEYEVEPAFVTSVVLLTTLASPLVLTPLLAYLK